MTSFSAQRECHYKENLQCYILLLSCIKKSSIKSLLIVIKSLHSDMKNLITIVLENRETNRKCFDFLHHIIESTLELENYELALLLLSSIARDLNLKIDQVFGFQQKLLKSL